MRRVSYDELTNQQLCSLPTNCKGKAEAIIGGSRPSTAWRNPFETDRLFSLQKAPSPLRLQEPQTEALSQKLKIIKEEKT